MNTLNCDINSLRSVGQNNSYFFFFFRDRKSEVLMIKIGICKRYAKAAAMQMNLKSWNWNKYKRSCLWESKRTTAQFQNVLVAFVENKQGNELAMSYWLLKSWTELKMWLLCLANSYWALHLPCFAWSKPQPNKESTKHGGDSSFHSIWVPCTSTELIQGATENTWGNREAGLECSSVDIYVCCLGLHDPKDSIGSMN